MRFSEIVQKAISMAKAADQARRTHGSDDDLPILSSGGDFSKMRVQPEEDYHLRTFLEGQPPPVVYMLTAIMYLGRGDFEARDLPDQYKDISETFGDPKWAARQMLGKQPLPQYLENGLKKLASASIDPDSLPAANCLAG